MSRSAPQTPRQTPTTPSTKITADHTHLQEFQQTMEQLQHLQQIVTSQRYTNRPEATTNIQNLQHTHGPPLPDENDEGDPMQQLQHARGVAATQTYRAWTPAERKYALKDRLGRLETVISMSRRGQRCRGEEGLGDFDAALDREWGLLVERCAGISEELGG